MLQKYLIKTRSNSWGMQFVINKFENHKSNSSNNSNNALKLFKEQRFNC